MRTKSTLEKIPPQALDVEEVILGALLLGDNGSEDSMDVIKEEYFYKESHKLVFRCIKTLYDRKEAIDIITITAELRQQGNLEIIGGGFFIASLTSRVASAANIEYHVKIIQQHYFKRELIRICSESVSNAYDDTTDVFEIIDNTVKIYDVVSSQVGRAVQRLNEALKERLLSYQEVLADGITGVPSGLVDLDRSTGGWQKSDLIIVAGRPSMGKTAFVLTCARNASIDFEKPIAVFSLEMSTAQLTDRLISGESEIESDLIRRQKIGPSDWMVVHKAVSTLERAPIFIDDTPGLTITQLTAKAKKLKKEEDIQMIIVDYLQLMHGNTEKGNREQEISGISRGLKGLAKTLNIPVIALSQLSRAVETRPGKGKRPILSDLRESGSIEQDADVVLFLFRPEYYDITEDEQGRSMAGLAELIIAKNRNGATGTVPVRFISRFTKFVDLADQFEYPSDQFPAYPAEDLNKKHFKSFVLKPSTIFDNDEDVPF